MSSFAMLLLASFQHDQLMAQRDDLSLHCSSATKADEKGIERHYYKVEHRRSRLTASGRKSNNPNTDAVFSRDS
jgi:hypothetical protein